MKDEDKARAAFTAARALQERAVQDEPDYGPPLCVLVIDAALAAKRKRYVKVAARLSFSPWKKMN